MSIQTLIKKKQNRLLSKTWRTELSAREIEKNNYHATRDVKRARKFVKTFRAMPTIETVDQHYFEPVTIFSAFHNAPS